MALCWVIAMSKVGGTRCSFFVFKNQTETNRVMKYAYCGIRRCSLVLSASSAASASAEAAAAAATVLLLLLLVLLLASAAAASAAAAATAAVAAAATATALLPVVLGVFFPFQLPCKSSDGCRTELTRKFQV